MRVASHCLTLRGHFIIIVVIIIIIIIIIMIIIMMIIIYVERGLPGGPWIGSGRFPLASATSCLSCSRETSKQEGSTATDLETSKVL